MSKKEYNLDKDKERQGYYIDITRPYEQIVQDIIKINPNAANEKYIINGTRNHSLQELIEHYKNEGHTLIDATPAVKTSSQNKKQLNSKNNSTEEELSEDFSGNRDISSPLYDEHFDRGNTFVDPSTGRYMSWEQRLKWNNAEAKNRAFNRQVDAIFGGALYGTAGMFGAGAAAPWITTTFAPGTIGGNILGDTAGMMAIDETSKALTGRTTGQHLGDAIGLAEDSNWRYAVDFINPINIMGPSLLHKGISSGINYADKTINPYKFFNTVKLPVKTNNFQEKPTLISKPQYRITDDAESFSIDDLNDYLLFDINVHPEVLAKRADNAEHAIDIYRKRLNNGGIKLVYDRGTANYKVSDIRVAQSKKDINDNINKLLEEDLKENPIPEAAYDYGVENILLNMRHQMLTGKLFLDNNSLFKMLKSNKALKHASKYDIEEFRDYIYGTSSIPLELKIARWSKLKNLVPSSIGFKTENFVWAPNKETLKEILKGQSIDYSEKLKYIRNWQETLPHEFEHAFQNAHKVYKKYFSPKHLISYDDLMSKNYSPRDFQHMVVEMSNLIGFRPRGKNKEYLANLTELLARGTQIKNWLGITDPYYQLTAKDLKEAAKYYTQTSPDTNMTEFFDSITDWNKAAKFLSYATAAAGVSSTVGLNNTKSNSSNRLNYFNK